MCEKVELERISLERERLNFEKQRCDEEVRFRCVEYASRNQQNSETTLLEAKEFLKFIRGN